MTIQVFSAVIVEEIEECDIPYWFIFSLLGWKRRVMERELRGQEDSVLWGLEEVGTIAVGRVET